MDESLEAQNNQEIIESIVAKLQRRIKLNISTTLQNPPIIDCDEDTLIDAIIRLEKQTQRRACTPKMRPFAWEQR
jgi:hypothetical protein